MVAATALALAVGLGGGWAASSLLKQPPQLPESPGYLVATATEDTVARSLGLDAKATWSGGTEVLGGLPGTVTSVAVTGAARVTSGQVVFDVDLKPVVVGEGEVPAFRDLRAGDQGADVRQLQRLLHLVNGSAGPIDGVFGVGLANDVKRWQRGLGLPVTGVVPKGSVLFVPSLPAVVSLAEAVRVGAPAPVGTPALRALPATPSFSVLLPSNQATLTKPGTAVKLTYGSASWTGQVTRLGLPGDDGSVLASIGPAAGAVSVCLATCAAIPSTGATVAADIVVVPAVTGVSVPTQALVVGSAGEAAVIDAAGRTIPVTVRASAGGVAVVDGLQEGHQIRVPTGG